MTGKLLWQTLKRLVECDKNVALASSDLLATRKNLDTDRAEIARLTSLMHEFQHRLQQEQKHIDFYELQAKDLQDKESEKRGHVDAIKNQKEYKAIEKEIAQVSSQRREVDELLIQAYFRLDAEKEKIAKEQGLYTKRIEQLSKDIEEKTAKIQDLEAKQVTLTLERDKVSASVPEEWLTRYERMKHSVPDPIVPVLNDTCSACFYSILYQDLIRLKKSGILLCKNCYRFLYYDEEEQKDSQKSSY